MLLQPQPLVNKERIGPASALAFAFEAANDGLVSSAHRVPAGAPIDRLEPADFADADRRRSTLSRIWSLSAKVPEVHRRLTLACCWRVQGPRRFVRGQRRERDGCRGARLLSWLGGFVNPAVTQARP